jgi:hypothetical protein
MSYNGSGVFNLVAGNPVVTGTTISSTWANNTLSDIATGLSSVITKDGQTTPTANIPMGGFKLTGLAAPTTNGDALRYENLATLATSGANSNITSLTGLTTPLSVAQGGTGLATTTAYSPVITGTTATGAFQASLGPGTSGQVLTSTGAGALPTWGSTIILGTPQASTSGTSILFSGIPAGVKEATVNFIGVSVTGSSPTTVRIGPSGGVETSGYFGATGFVPNAGATVAGAISTGFDLTPAGASTQVFNGSLKLSLVNSSNNTWACSATLGRSDNPIVCFLGGGKVLAGALERISITTTGGTDTFDAGSINISYKS